MEFELNYRSHRGHAVDQAHSVIGTDGIDKIRADLKISLPIDRIRGYVDRINTDISFEIIEQIARESDLFTDCNQISVQVLPDELNEFTHLETRYDCNEETGEITKAWLTWVVDEYAILSAWVAAGYPTDWRRIPKTEETA